MSEINDSKKLESLFPIKQGGIVTNTLQGASIKLMPLDSGNFPEGQVMLTKAISDAIEEKRKELINKYPDFIIGNQSGLLSPQRNYYAGLPWDEIICSAPEIIDSVEGKTKSPRAIIFNCILALNPPHAITIFWMFEFDKTYSLLKSAVADSALFVKILMKQKSDLEKMAKEQIETRKSIAKKGGDRKSQKTKELESEFLRRVDKWTSEHKKIGEKTTADIERALCDILPDFIKYSTDHYSRAIGITSTLPKKWLRTHWQLAKRQYKKRPSK